MDTRELYVAKEILNRGGAPKAIWRLHDALLNGWGEQTVWLLVARTTPLPKDVVKYIQGLVAQGTPKPSLSSRFSPYKPISSYLLYLATDLWLARDLEYPEAKKQTMWLLISKHHALWSGLPRELVLMFQEYVATQNPMKWTIHDSMLWIPFNY